MERMKKAGIITRGRIDCFTDRNQGLAALEEAVLDARIGFRAALQDFDPELALVSPRGRKIGRTWYDLILHTLGRGVAISITLDNPGPASGRSDMLDVLNRRIDAEPHIGRRCGDLRLDALSHPAQRAKMHPGYRMNLAVIDDRVLFVSRHGLVPVVSRDLTLIAHGPVVGEGVGFLDSYAAICAGTREPAPARRLLRTLSRPARGIGRLFGPQTVANEIESAHHMLIRRATQLIYIETQRFDSLPLAEHLARRAQATPELSLILIQSHPPEGRDALRAARILARSFGSRALLCHAPAGCTNVSIFDDQMAIAGSVDLDGRGLHADVGISLYLRASDGVADLRRTLARHWIADISPEAGAQEWLRSLGGATGLVPLALGRSGAAQDSPVGSETRRLDRS